MIYLIFTLPEGHRVKLIPPLDWQTPLCYMPVIPLKPVTNKIIEILDETVIIDLIFTLSEGHRAKLTPPLYFNPVIHLEDVTNIVSD